MSSRRSIPTTDRISALPDSLIYHILSFLPTKLSIATSVLSKRWTQLWKSVLTLDFNDQSFTDFSNFRHFVYSVIVSRDITLPLQSFRISIKCQSNFDPRDVNRFVHAAVQRGIQNLDIDVVPSWEAAESEETVPGLFRVLSCRTLVVLILNALTFHDVPQSVDLPLLKTLHLNWILCYNNGNFMNLLRGCPILENFHTTNVRLCQFSNDLAAEFNGFPKLVKAKLSEPEQEFPFVWFRNATFLHAELVCYVLCLILRSWTWLLLFYLYLHLMQESIYELRVPTFHNLTHMKLIFATASYEVEKWKWKWVTRLLQHCPKLQNFIIKV